MNTALCVFQFIVYLLLKRTMRRKLYYFYDHAMKELKILLISNVIFQNSNTAMNVFYLIDGRDYNLYLAEESKSVEFNIMFSIIGLIQYMLLYCYVYYSNKYIDLELYIRLLMYGHRVLEYFDNISYFI